MSLSLGFYTFVTDAKGSVNVCVANLLFPEGLVIAGQLSASLIFAMVCFTKNIFLSYAFGSLAPSHCPIFLSSDEPRVGVAVIAQILGQSVQASSNAPL